MINDLYARARILTVEALIGYDEDDRPGALFSVVGEMMKEARSLGIGKRELVEGLRELAEEVFAEEDAAEILAAFRDRVVDAVEAGALAYPPKE
jgi:hypothetical protein